MNRKYRSFRFSYNQQHTVSGFLTRSSRALQLQWLPSILSTSDIPQLTWIFSTRAYLHCNYLCDLSIVICLVPRKKLFCSNTLTLSFDLIRSYYCCTPVSTRTIWARTSTSLKINWINIWIRTSYVWLASRASCFLELSADFRHRCRATLQTTNLPCIYYANMNESNSLNHSKSFRLDLMQYHISWISTSFLLDDASFFFYTTNNCTTLLLHRYYHFMQHTSHEVISTSMHQEIPCDMIYDIIRHISTAYLPRAKLISYIHSTRRSDTRDLILSHLHFFFRTFNR